MLCRCTTSGRNEPTTSRIPRRPDVDHSIRAVAPSRGPSPAGGGSSSMWRGGGGAYGGGRQGGVEVQRGLAPVGGGDPGDQPVAVGEAEELAQPPHLALRPGDHGVV